MPTLGAELTRLRKAAGLTQGELAHRADITQSFLSEIETGKKPPAVGTARKLAMHLGKPSAYFVHYLDGGVGPPPPEPSLEIPIIGYAGAGPPVLNFEPLGTLAIKEKLGVDGLEGVRVRGWSMVGDLIGDGDYVLFRPDPDPDKGRAVVASVGGELLVKILGRRTPFEVHFQSRDAVGKVAIYDPSEVDVRILGTLHSVLRFDDDHPYRGPINARHPDGRKGKRAKG